tara:strand:+ start:115 stop:462 length:348 start_codon:yes stop_codon:yes gene_type:complete
MERHIEIASTIRDQILTLDPYALMAYGASKFVALSKEHAKDLAALGGLKFKVNGLKHKGHVIISLMGNDTYTVRTCKITLTGKNAGRVVFKEEAEDVYADQLIDILDRFVEGQGA